jgi:hypothetical protein
MHAQPVRILITPVPPPHRHHHRVSEFAMKGWLKRRTKTHDTDNFFAVGERTG